MADPYPERQAGGFTRADGSVQFYGRVHAILADLGPGSVVLDYGAGRGAALDRPAAVHRRLADLRPKAERVIGVDVEDAVLTNPALTEAHVIALDAPIPAADGSVDLVLADHTFEHVQDPARVARELERVLRPGGWICARTPNRWGYIGLGSRFVPNRLHARVLRRVQPGRLAEDVFPTVYRLNSRAHIAEHFPPSRFEHMIYGWEPEPAYGGHSRAVGGLFRLLARVTPERCRPTLMVFLRRRA